MQVLPTPFSTTENPELAGRFNAVLNEVVSALLGTEVHYVFIGGIASGGLGRPRSTHDIDLFVRPEDAEIVLRALDKHGFLIEKTDPTWLYKAFKEDILVDVIFKSKGEIYLDSEMYGRSISVQYHGLKIRMVAPEDLLIIKVAAHSELCPNHWHDAIALLSHASLDWNYLIHRAKRAPRRVLSLLLYAQSNDIWVPNHVIHELYRSVFGDASPVPRPGANLGAEKMASRSPLPLSRVQEYAISHLHESLAQDPRTNELNIQIEHSGNKILLRGEVSAPERRDAVMEVVRECLPDAAIENQVRVLHFQEPAAAEEVE
ncbi:nucleotidyltransferase [Bdellovibrionota bacterium FG-1]